MLEIYQAEDCPYSTKVREKLAELGVSYVIHNPRYADGDVRNDQTYEELLSIGDEDQVPFLIDRTHEETLYESNAIIEHLEEYYG